MSNYYSHPYVSNSDLSKLKKELQTPEIEMELTDAYKNGSLVDAMLTEKSKVYHFDQQLLGTDYTYLPHEFTRAHKMATKCEKEYGNLFVNSKGQMEFYEQDIPFEYNGVDYCLDMRCKFDFYHPSLGIEIKTTAYTSQAQFISTIDRLDYDRAAWLYMTLGKLDRMLILGISKKSPHNIFPVYIKRDDPLFERGRAKASELAFKYFMLKS